MISTIRTTPRLALAAATFALAATGAVVTAQPANAAPDTACQRAGLAVLKSEGLLSTVARSGLPISLAVEKGVVPRDGTDVSALPDPLPLSVVLADHRAGDNSLFLYPWC